MKLILVIADIGWSIGRIHKDIERVLGKEYKFIFMNCASFFMDELKRLFAKCDMCLTTLNLHTDMIQLFPSVVELSKIMFVCHGHSEISIENVMYKYVTYGTVSDILIPFFPTAVHVVPNGVDLSSFSFNQRSGAIQTLGWCGAPKVYVKRYEMFEQIADIMKLQTSIASTLTYDELKTWYHTIDILLVTSGPDAYVETGPLPPFEAIASGVLVIGTPVGNFRHTPGPKFHTMEEACDILQILCKNPDMVRKIAEEQFAWVSTKWNYTILGEAWKEMFESTYKKVQIAKEVGVERIEDQN